MKDGSGVAIAIIFILSGLLSLAVVGVVIWAVIELVQWVTTK